MGDDPNHGSSPPNRDQTWREARQRELDEHHRRMHEGHLEFQREYEQLLKKIAMLPPIKDPPRS